MPEVPVCERCGRAIHKETDPYVIPNKHVDRRPNWQYYHLDCHEAIEKEVEDQPTRG
jgi:hypothetical protein